MKKKKITTGILSAVICHILFGFSFLFTKRVTNSVSAMTLISWRFIFAFILINICLLVRIIKIDFRKKQILPLVLMSLFQPVIYFIGETVGVNLTTASESGTIIACIPVVTLVLSSVILNETPAKLQVTGVAITTIGIITVVLMKGFEASFNLTGYAMLLLAVIACSLYAVLSQKAAEFTSVEKTYVMMAAGAITFTIAALAENISSGSLKDYILIPFTNLDFLIAILYLSAGCSVAAFLLYNTAIENIGTSRTASFAGITTIVTVISGIVLLREDFSIYQGLGTALVLGGVYLANANKSDMKLERGVINE